MQRRAAGSVRQRTSCGSDIVRLFLATCSLVTLLALSPMSLTGDWPRMALAQASGQPPAVGAPFLIESLSSKGSFVFGECPTGRTSGTYQGDGAHLSVKGRCVGNAPYASMIGLSTDVSLEDGEVTVDLRMLEGAERAALGLLVRTNVDGSGYWIGWLPAAGQLYVRNGISETSRFLGARSGIVSTDPDGWMRLTVRMQGDLIWILADERPVLALLGNGSTRGGVGLMLVRFGDPEADVPAEGLWKNFSVSALANGDPARGPGKAFAAPGTGNRSRSQPPSATQPAARRAGPTGQPPAAPGTPPAIAELAYEEPLTQPGIIRPMPCPNGKTRGEVTPEGYVLSVRGRCEDGEGGVTATVYLAGLDLADGDVQVEFKLTAGHERALVALMTRLGDADDPTGYAWPVQARLGHASIHALDFAAGRERQIAIRRELPTLLRPTDWNTLAARQLGDTHWLFVNGVPVATVEDRTASAGGVLLMVLRQGDRADDQEVAVTFRNLRISTLVGTSPERLPILTEPDEPPSTAPGMVVGQSAEPQIRWTAPLATETALPPATTWAAVHQD